MATEERAEAEAPKRCRARGKRPPLPCETAESLGAGGAQDPLEAALADVEKVEGRLPVRQAGKKAKSAAKTKLSAAFSAGPRKRPAGRNTHPCGGRGADWPCIYNLQSPGTCGSFDHHSPNHGRKCVLCDDKAINRLCGSAAGRSHILSNMKKFRAAYEEKPHVYNSALLRIPDKHREEIHKKAAAQALPRAAARRERARRPRPAPAQTAKTSWATALASRKRVWRPLTAAEAKKHKRQVKAARKRVQKKFFEDHDLKGPPAEDIAYNDAGLPAPALSEQGRFVELWAKFGSWGIARIAAPCSRGAWSRSIAAGWPSQRSPREPARRARTGRSLSQSLRTSQSRSEISPRKSALRPLDIDVGPYRRTAYGYRAHSAMIRLAWAAYDFLMASEETAYGDFVEKHDKFLEREGEEEAPEQRRKRPLQFLETPGVENALWPNLYWAEEMCETSIRASDVRRQRRRSAADPAQEVGGPRPEQRRRRWQTAAEDSGSEEGEGEDGGRQSIKKSFMKKVLGPIAGYAEDFELLQFVYDLSLWSRIGGGKNACKHIPLRLVLKGETFSPLYFKTRHAALIDLQRQCGHPQIFKTMAPWNPASPTTRGSSTRWRRRGVGPTDYGPETSQSLPRQRPRSLPQPELPARAEAG